MNSQKHIDIGQSLVVLFRSGHSCLRSKERMQETRAASMCLFFHAPLGLIMISHKKI